MRRRAELTLACALLGGCYLSRPAFVEPRWGDAPAAHADELTELTHEQQECSDHRCTRERVILRRDGRATREFWTGTTRDSTLLAPLDSGAFISIANAVIRGGLFQAPEADGPEPLRARSSMTSAAALCRRKIVVWSEGEPGPAAFERSIDSAERAIAWHRPVFVR